MNALDMSIRRSTLNLVKEVQEALGASNFFCAHDLSNARFVCHDVAVMCNGRIFESGPAERIVDSSSQPHIQVLLGAVPTAHPHVQRARRRSLAHPRLGSWSLREMQPTPSRAI